MSNATATSKDNVYMAKLPVRRWGNSQGIRLPKEIINRMQINENDEVGINIVDGKMIVEKICKPKYRNLTERLEAFYDKPIEEIYVESSEDIYDEPLGEEIW